MNQNLFTKLLLALLCAGLVAWATAPAALALEAAPAEEAAADDAAAEEAAAGETEAGEEEEAAADAGSFELQTEYTINTLIMFVCAVLVLFMQAGFAMVEVGLNSAKNTVNILFKNVMDLSVGVLLFLFVGYGLMYHDGNPYFGFGGPFVGDDPVVAEAESYSNSADFLFQVAFAATAATIVSGCVAGRMRFEAYLIYSAVITGFIYPISGYWKWGEGWLHQMHFQDFAGSVVVHAVGGFAGLAGAIMLGPRLGRYTKDGKSIPIPGHNLAFAALGVLILWVGWYGFNPGSQLTYFGTAGANATSFIALTTTISAAAGSLVAMLTAWILFKKPDLTMALNGALAGLVGITANCDRVTQPAALLIGAVAGVLVVAGIVALDKLRIDDPVGAFPVHGLCGVWGGVATGLLGAIPVEEGVAVFTRTTYIGVQVFSTAVICVWAFVTALILFSVLKMVGILRVSPEEEQAGLDISEHGMHAYPPATVGDSYVGVPVGKGAPTPTETMTTGA